MCLGIEIIDPYAWLLIRIKYPIRVFVSRNARKSLIAVRILVVDLRCIGRR